MIAGPFKFSEASKLKLKELHPDLQAVLKEAIKYIDFTITEAHRPQVRQDQLFAQGRTKPGPIVTWVRTGKHNSFPSQAVDLAPHPVDWKDNDRFIYLAGIIMGISAHMGIDLRWGGDWDEDNNLKEETKKDVPHFEVR